MTAKRVTIAMKPATPTAEIWVTQGNGGDVGAAPTRANIYTARLTIDVTPALHGRIKVAAFRRGITVADVLRALLEDSFPEDDGGTS